MLGCVVMKLHVFVWNVSGTIGTWTREDGIVLELPHSVLGTSSIPCVCFFACEELRESDGVIFWLCLYICIWIFVSMCECVHVQLEVSKMYVDIDVY